MRNSQRGVTFLGWLFLLLPIAIVGYVGIRLTPIYLNYMAVARSMEQLADESAGDQQPNPVALRASLEKRFDIEGINHPTIKDIEIRREGEGWVAIADYEDLSPLFANVSILVQFHKQVEL